MMVSLNRPSLNKLSVMKYVGSRLAQDKALLIDILLVLAPLPMVTLFFITMWQQRPHYQFFPLHLAAAGYLLWSGWIAVRNVETSSPTLHGACRWLGVIGLAASIWIVSPWLSLVSWLFLIASFCFRDTAGTKIRNWLPAWIALWIVVPPPNGVDNDLVRYLRTWTAQKSSFVLDWLDVSHLPAGNTFEVVGKQFFVEDACSGVHSLFALISLAALYAIYARQSWFVGMFSIAFSVVASVGLNVLRVVLIIVAQTKFEWDLSSGWQHELLGFVLFSLGIALLLSAIELASFLRIHWLCWWAPGDDWLFSVETCPKTKTDVPQKPPSGNPQQTPRINIATKVAAVIAFLLLIPQAIHIAQAANLVGNSRNATTDVALVNEMISESLLPDQFQQWERVTFEDNLRHQADLMGSHTRKWIYQAPFGKVIFALDYPFTNNHPLFMCYEAIGWTTKLDPAKPIEQGEIGNSTGSYQPVSMQRSLEQGYLLYTFFDRQGDWYPVSAGVGLHSSWTAQMAQRLTWQSPVTTFQFQAFVISDASISATERVVVEKSFFEALELVRTKFCEHDHGRPSPVEKSRQTPESPAQSTFNAKTQSRDSAPINSATTDSVVPTAQTDQKDDQ